MTRKDKLDVYITDIGNRVRSISVRLSTIREIGEYSDTDLLLEDINLIKKDLIQLEKDVKSFAIFKISRNSRDVN